MRLLARVCLTLACAIALSITTRGFERAHVAQPAKTTAQVAVARLASAPDRLLTLDDVTLRYREIESGQPARRDRAAGELRDHA